MHGLWVAANLVSAIRAVCWNWSAALPNRGWSVVERGEVEVRGHWSVGGGPGEADSAGAAGGRSGTWIGLTMPMARIASTISRVGILRCQSDPP